VEGDVILPDEEVDSIFEDFKFHGIGNVLKSDMNDEGYVDAEKSPFGSTIDVIGQFKDALQGKYYRVLYAEWENDITPPVENDFAPILNEVWPVAELGGAGWETFSKSPIELPGGIEGCYEIPDYNNYSLTSKTTLIRWSTHRIDLGAPRYPDGKYTLKVEAYKDDGTEIELLPSRGNEELNVRIDNTWPVAEIKGDIGIIGGTIPLCSETDEEICDNPEVCGIIYIESGKKARIKFDAYDEQNHFRRYKLTYRTGDGNEIPISDGSNDYGFTDETVDWEIGGLSQCGYEIRLEVWDRTTNGYRLIHRTEDFIHLILLDIP
jgi:hypothetical protein